MKENNGMMGEGVTIFSNVNCPTQPRWLPGMVTLAFYFQYSNTLWDNQPLFPFLRPGGINMNLAASNLSKRGRQWEINNDPSVPLSKQSMDNIEVGVLLALRQLPIPSTPNHSGLHWRVHLSFNMGSKLCWNPVSVKYGSPRWGCPSRLMDQHYSGL